MTTPNPRTALRQALERREQVARSPHSGHALAAAGLNVIAPAWALLEWMEANSVDPDDPPSCSCGDRHWTCDYDPDAEDDEDEPETCAQCCTETEGLEDIQGTLLCPGCIAYNESRCM